jgi:RNA polymerase sigma-70 factor (ECF subfamily)
MAHSASQRLERIRSAIDQYQSRLIAFAVRITRDLESARDVVQDTFVRLCQQDLDAIGDHLPAWLYRVCRNRALDIRRKEGRLEPIDEAPEHAAGSSGSDPHRLLETADHSSRVLAAVAQLPPAQQEVLRLRFQEELSYKEIGAVTGRSVNNVGVLIHTAIRQVRQHLRAEGGRSDG